MKNLYLFLLIAIVPFCLRAQTVSINQPYTDTVVCQGDNRTLNFTTTGSFSVGNVFTAQLSNAAGSFSSPLNIGAVTANASGSISITIPQTIFAGTAYRIRIVSTAPAVTSADDGKDIKIQSGPSFNISGNTNVCDGDTLRLSVPAVPGVNYIWTGPGLFQAGIQQLTFPSVSNINAGQYIVQGIFLATGCGWKDTVEVTLKPKTPKPAASGNSPLCAGDTLFLKGGTAIPGASYTWETPSSPLTGKDVALRAFGISPARYIVKASINGCVSRDTVFITINAVPSVDAQVSFPFPGGYCTGGSFQLAASPVNAGATYHWTGPGTYVSDKVKDTITNATHSDSGFYHVTVTQNGCKAKDSVLVMIRQSPPKPQLSYNGPVCFGDSVILTVSNINPFDEQYWYGNDKNVSPFIQKYTAKDTNTYWRTVTARAGLCSTFSDTLYIDIKPGPQKLAMSHIISDTLETPLDLKATVTPYISGMQYSWTGPSGNASADSILHINTLKRTDKGIYHVTVSYNGCSKTDSVSVDVYTLFASYQVLPNPNDGNFVVVGPYIPNLSSFSVQVFNSNGMQISDKSLPVFIGSHSANKVSLPDLPAGIYYLRIVAGKQQMGTAKFVIRH